MQRQGIRLHVYGDTGDLPLSARTALTTTARATALNTALTLNLALNYSGRGEIVRAAQRLIDDGVREATEQALRDRLFSRGQPDPDLIIRTSGELRLSNFLIFQSAYSELVFSETLWPDFTPDCLRAALDVYAGRKRRFGLTQEQMPT
jgi:undecaprenyl diphosphate synthase